MNDKIKWCVYNANCNFNFLITSLTNYYLYWGLATRERESRSLRIDCGLAESRLHQHGELQI